MPDALRTELEPEGILAEFANVKVRYRFSGRVPGLVSMLDVRSSSGALIMTEERLGAACT